MTAAPTLPLPGARPGKPDSRIPPGIFALPFGVVLLLFGLWGGLRLLDYDLPDATLSASQHGFLMSIGFLGTLISTERAVALARAWAWGVPALSATGSLWLVLGGPAAIGYATLLVAGILLVAVYIRLDRIQRSAHNTLMGVAAAGWAVAAGLALGGMPIRGTAPWLAIFLVVTITAERLELSRMLRRTTPVRVSLMVAIMTMVAGATISIWLPDAGIRITGIAMAAMAIWLIIWDLARRTVRAKVVTRFMAVGLLTGYGWLLAGGILWAATGFVIENGFLHDAQLHIIFLGFVMSMVFAHAPVIAPAVIRKPLPYFPIFYGPLALLHVALFIRVVPGDAFGLTAARQWGGIFNEVAILAFVAVTVGAFIRQAATDRKHFAAIAAQRAGDVMTSNTTPGPEAASTPGMDTAAAGKAPRKTVSTIIGAVLGVAILVTAVLIANSGRTPSTPAEAPTAGPVVDAATAAAGVDVSLVEMRIEPSAIVVEPGATLVLNVTNHGNMRHDLVLDNGVGTPLLNPGETYRLEVGTVDTALDGWCTVPGHKAAGMTMTIGIAGAATSDTGTSAASSGGMDHAGMMGGGSATTNSGNAVSSDISAPPPAGWKPIDATLPPAANTTVHQVTWHVRDMVTQVAPDVTQNLWTFDEQVPGPALRGKVGDRFEVTVVNDTEMTHNIDFHAMEGPPATVMTPIPPGETHTYTFEATHAGAWLYHCSIEPMLLHMGNGMYGALIIDPPGLAPADKEFVLVTSEMFFGPEGDIGDLAKMMVDQPDTAVFNGYPFAYDHAPLQAKVDELVRIWIVDAGPTRSVAFHVIGAPFITQYLNGAYLLKDGKSHGQESGAAQTLPVDPGNGGFVELRFKLPGSYPFVNHSMASAILGQTGTFEVSE